MKGLTFFMWNFIMIYPLVLKIYRENLKFSAITGRLPVYICQVISHTGIFKLKLCPIQNGQLIYWTDIRFNWHLRLFGAKLICSFWDMSINFFTLICVVCGNCHKIRFPVRKFTRRYVNIRNTLQMRSSSSGRVATKVTKTQRNSKFYRIIL